MKKFIPALFILQFLLLSFIQGDNSALDFKIRIKPNRTYTQTSTNTAKSIITYLCNQSYLDTLKSKGITNPSIKESAQEHTTIIKTGSTDKMTKRFPVVIHTDNTLLDKDKKPLTDKIYVYGQCEQSSIPTFDSITKSAALSTEVKTMLLQTVQNSFSQLSLPDKMLKVGDVFSRTTPIRMPLGSGKIEVDLVTTFKLAKKTKDSAYFTTKEVYTAKMDIANDKSSLLGKGKGDFTYDIKNNYYSSYKTTDTLLMHLKYTADISMDITSINGYSMKTVITK